MRQPIVIFYLHHMKKWLSAIFVFVFFSIQAEEISAEWKNSLNSLSDEERRSLQTFFRTMIVNSEGGFVLFGSKPACGEGIIAPGKCKIEWIGMRNHRRSIDLWEGYQVWQKYFASLKTRKLIISLKDHPDNLFTDWIHLTWINPQKLMEVVNENLVLFQYVLGPDVTPQRLLDHLVDPSQDILEDYTLQGITLGFGVQNALYYRRLELIEKELYSKEKIPFKSRYERIEIADPFHGLYMGFDLNPVSETTPSFNHSSLSTEYQNLLSERSSSLKTPHQQINPIPMFAIFKNDKNTKQIRSGYEVDRLKIQDLLAQDNFLEHILKTIFE